MHTHEVTTREYKSETSKHRELVSQYCVGAGIDVGFGGDPVNASALRMDLPQPYAATGQYPVQLPGDCRDLFWFRDGVLDFVYSSHVLEDFKESETEAVLLEWLRVIKPGGQLVLLLPDQQRYIAFCREDGQYSSETGIYGNPHHSIPHFSLAYVVQIATRIGGVEVAAEHPQVDEYSFVLVLRKLTSNVAASELNELREKLHHALVEGDVAKHELREKDRELRLLRSTSILHRAFSRAIRILGVGRKR